MGAVFTITSSLRRILSRYTFSKKAKTGKDLVLSSLYKLAKTLDLCGPAAARIQHVTAASRASVSSCSDTYIRPPKIRHAQCF